jgi:hypothetical protein
MLNPYRAVLWLDQAFRQCDASCCCIGQQFIVDTAAAMEQMLHSGGQFFALAFSVLSM